jgi:lysyl-tRNA synthetase class 2
MILTDSSSIQDVIFFPQMRPEKRLRVDEDEAFVTIGVPVEWIPLIRKAGYNTVESMKKADPNKLANDLNGLRKKNKLDIPALTRDIIAAWQEKG